MSDETAKDHKPIVGHTRAPYEANSDPVTSTPGRRPWDLAGLSWYDEAERLRSYYRTQRGIIGRLRTNTLFEHEDLSYALARARACRRVAKDLDPLIAHGYVMWHDRRIAGTDMIADHVLVGPEGLTIIQTLPKSAASAGPYISPAAGVERQHAQYRADAIAEQFERRLTSGWHVVVFAVVCVDGNSPGVSQAPQVVPRVSVVNLARQRPRRLVPVQVADLAMMLEPAFASATSATGV